MTSALGQPNAITIGWFLVFIALSLGITVWASRRTRSTDQFYAAGRSVTALQNGLALAGDYMSAASFLGIAGLVALSGFDGLIYSVGFLVGWPIVMFLIAEPLRNLGRYTFADVVAFRLRQVPVRIAASIGSLAVVSFYLIAQMVGAGNLIRLLFGMPYEVAVVIVGAVMLGYVLFGGMIATTWVQIVKAVLLLGGASILALMVLARFGFNPLTLFEAAAGKYGATVLAPGRLVTDPLDAVSLGLALMLGTAGLPHILMRFFTVPNATQARKSVMWATTWIGYFYVLTFIIGFGAITFVLTNPQFLDAKGALLGGGNMAAVHLANAVGGNVFLGFISAVAFATILAVVAGLTLSGASAVSHDLYAVVFKRGRVDSATELRVSRMTTVALGIVAVVLGIAFEKQNIAFMVSLAFAIAASANFPVLLMSVLWKDCTTRGAVVGGFLGLISSVVLTIVSPSVWEVTLGNPKGSALFPYASPALFSMAIGFFGIWLFSVLDRGARAAQDRAGFPAQQVRSETGIGASAASGH